MRSLHFIETFRSSGGGVPRVALTIQHYFKDDLVLPVKELSFYDIFKKLFFFGKGQGGVDGVFIHNIYSVKAVLLGFFSGFLFRSKVYVTSHGATNRKFVVGSKKKSIYLILFLNLSKFFVHKFHFLNEGEYGDSFFYKRIGEKICVFSYPVFLGVSVPLREDVANKNKLKVVFYSRVEKRKGIFFLISAIENLIERGVNVELDVFGPLEDSSISDRIKSSKGVTYRGLITLADYVRVSSEFDVFCLPSQGEAHSLALLENMAIGMPCLVSIESNPPKSAGVIVYGQHDDVDALTNEMLGLLNFDERRKASRANLQFSEGYNDSVMSRIDEILRGF